MDITLREAWTVLHGLVFGSIFLLAFAGGLDLPPKTGPVFMTVPPGLAA